PGARSASCRARRPGVVRAGASDPAIPPRASSACGVRAQVRTLASRVAELRALTRRVADERLVEQAAGFHPIAPHGSLRDAQGLCRLLLRHAVEEAAIHDASKTLVEQRKLVERLMELEQRLGLVVGGGQSVVERDRSVRTTAFFGCPTPGAIHEDVAHGDA